MATTKRYYKAEPVDMNEKFYRTDNRGLEQFLYAHMIDFINLKRNDEDRCVWTYAVSNELKEIVEEFNEIVEVKC